MRCVRAIVTFLFCGALACVQTSKADTGAKPMAIPETPLLITSGYGVHGLVLWLAADSGVKLDENNCVSSLADKTGNFTLTASDPDRRPAYVTGILNGEPVLRFNPDQALISADEFGTELDRDMTIIVVSKTDASRTFMQYPLYLGQNRTSHANRAIAYYQGKELFDGQWVGFTGPPIMRNAFVVLGVTVNPSVTQAAFYRNGRFMMNSVLGKEHEKASFENLSPGVALGAAPDPCRGWLGDIAEALVFDRQLSPAEMQTVWWALSLKYGLKQQAVGTTSPQ